MKEPNFRNYYIHGGNRSNSVPRYYGGAAGPATVLDSEASDGKQIIRSSESTSSATNRFRSRDRSLSTDGCQRNNEKRQAKDLNELEHRRHYAYVTRILEHYYSHPSSSNRKHSFPSAIREQILNALIPSEEDQRRRMASRDVAGATLDDFGSEISSAHRPGAYHRSGSARTASEHSPFYDDYSSTMTSGSRGSKKKSRFFRSSSMRSLKKWMNKLRGRVNSGSGSGRKKGSVGSGSLSPNCDDVLSNGLTAPSHDSGLETPSDTSLNQNLTNLRLIEQRNSLDAIVGATGRGRSRNLSATMPPIVDIPTPALCGIVNHGNTCYINAVLQCLSNTDILAEYFLSGQYWTDLKNNLRNADRYGSQGNVTLALARFFKALWFNTYTPEVSSNFKGIVERYSEQYRGNQQQDAQEFFYWLADRVHEDLNVAVKRRYKLHKSRSKNEDELAAAAMEKHLEAHNSFISASFHGLFLSTVTCPVCRKQSMKPDPFMCISLPVSQCTKRPLFVVVVFINRQPRQVRFGLNADVTATFLEVKKCLADATDLTVDQMLLCEMNDFGFQTTLIDHHEVMSLGQTKCVWAFEIPVGFHGITRAPVASRDDEIVLLVGHQVASSVGGGLRFGSPFALKVNREVTYGDLFRSLVFALRPQLRPGVVPQEIPMTSFRMRIVDDYHPFVFIPSDVSLPLYTQPVDNALMNLSVSGSPFALPHLKVMLEWNREARERYFNSSEERIVDHVSAQDLRDQEEHPEVQSIHDCLAEYTRPDSCQWYCPDCRRRQDNATKRIVFYWLPDVLVLHLKRFKQLSSGQLVKLDSTVWFPVSDLDLSDYTHQSISRNHRKHQQHHQRPSQSYRTQNGELYVDTRPSQNLYDLFAVCNHSGHSPHSGHYTAFCRNPVNGRWYCFDDQNVTPMRERDLVTNGAYLLFYERRQLRKGSNGHSSAESGFIDHWFFRIYSSHLNDRERRSSYSSKDTLDGVDSNGGSSGAASQGKISTDGVQRRPLESLSALAIANGESSRNQLYDQNGTSRYEDSSGRNSARNGTDLGDQFASIEFASFMNAKSKRTGQDSLEETSPTSNEDSRTVIAESPKSSAIRKDLEGSAGNSVRASIGRVLSAPHDDRSGPYELFGSSQSTHVSVKLNEKMNQPRRECKISEEQENGMDAACHAPSSSGFGKGIRRDSASSDVGTLGLRTYSFVETDL